MKNNGGELNFATLASAAETNPDFELDLHYGHVRSSFMVNLDPYYSTMHVRRGTESSHSQM